MREKYKNNPEHREKILAQQREAYNNNAEFRVKKAASAKARRDENMKIVRDFKNNKSIQIQIQTNS